MSAKAATQDFLEAFASGLVLKHAQRKTDAYPRRRLTTPILNENEPPPASTGGGSCIPERNFHD